MADIVYLTYTIEWCCSKTNKSVNYITIDKESYLKNYR